MSDIEKIHGITPDLTRENVDRLLALFPDVATEITDPKTGRTERAVDFDALKERLGDVTEGNRERYQFTWPGKREAKRLAREPIAKTLRPVKERSKDWDTTKNLYIEGDNLDALKLLRENYAGKVKLIYIDPPYNTGHDFIYKDNFGKSASILGSFMVATVTSITGNPSLGVLSIGVLLVLALVFLVLQKDPMKA